MKTEQTALMVGFAGIVIAFAALGIAGQTMLNVNEVDTHTHTSFSDDKELVKWINDNFVSEGEWAHHNQVLNSSFSAIEKDLDSAGLAISTINNKFIIIEHQSNVPTTTPDSTAKCAADFNLVTLALSGTEETEFAKNMAVFIKGSYTNAGEAYSYKVMETGKSTVLKTNSGTVAGDNSLLGIFNEAINQEVGSYTAEFKIAGMTDCISFKIVP